MYLPLNIFYLHVHHLLNPSFLQRDRYYGDILVNLEPSTNYPKWRRS